MPCQIDIEEKQMIDMMHADKENGNVLYWYKAGVVSTRPVDDDGIIRSLHCLGCNYGLGHLHIIIFIMSHHIVSYCILSHRII